MPHFASLYYGIMPLKSNNTLTKFTRQEFPAVSQKTIAKSKETFTTLSDAFLS